ncbi:unnamed protein product, partial [Prorocentrum cordatum]
MARGIAQLDAAQCAAFASRRGIQSSFSGEAEFYGATSAVIDGGLIDRVPGWPGYGVTWELAIDGSAAKAMISREGVGEVKRVDVGSEYMGELAGIVDCSEMGERKELEACAVSSSASWAKQGLLAARQ